MNVSENQDVAKQNIMTWCTDDGITCVDESSRNPTFSWLLALSNPQILFYKQPNLQDRIYAQSQINVSPQHQTMIEGWDATKRNNMILNLQTLATQFDININFQQDGNKITSISSFKIHFHSTIKKSDFLDLLVRVQNIHNSFLNQLRFSLGLELQQLQSQQQPSESTNPAIG